MWFCFLCGLMCLLPVCLQMSSNIELKPLRHSLSDSQWFTYCCVASISLSVPLFLDIILDLVVMFVGVTSSVKIKKQKDAVGFTFLNIPERLLILIGMTVVPIVGFLPDTTVNLALIYLCCNNCRLTLVGGVMLLSLSRYDKDYWSVRTTWFSLLFYSTGLVSGSFISNIYAAESTPTQAILILDSCTYFLTLVPSLLFIINSLRWLIIAYLGMNPWQMLMNCLSDEQHLADLVVLKVKDARDHKFFPMVYVIIGVIIVIFIAALLASAPRVENYDPISLALNSAPYVCFLIAVSTLSMRMVKFEVVQGLVSNICLLLMLLRLFLVSRTNFPCRMLTRLFLLL